MQDKTSLDGSEKGQKTNKISGYIQVAAIVAVIGVAVYFAQAPDLVEKLSRPSVDGDMTAPSVQVVRPEAINRSLSLQLTGNVVLKNRAKVISEIVGRVNYVSPNFDAGGVLKANEVIVKIEPEEYELKVREVEQQIAALESAMASQEIPQGSGSAASITLEAAKVRLRLAQINLEKTELSFPFASRVIGATVQVGELVGPAEITGRSVELGRVYRPDSIRLVTDISDDEIESFSPIIGRMARITAGNEVYDAQVVAVSNMLEPDSRLSRIFLDFSKDIPVEQLPLPRTFVEIEIDGPRHENVFHLPETVEQDGERVWIVQDGSLVSFQPELIRRLDDGWLVRAFDFGEGIIMGNIPGLREGLKVNATSPEA